MPMHMVEFLKHISTALLLLTGLCFFYQTVYLVVSLFWREPKHKPEKPARYAILIAARNEEAVLRTGLSLRTHHDLCRG